MTGTVEISTFKANRRNIHNERESGGLLFGWQIFITLFGPSYAPLFEIVFLLFVFVVCVILVIMSRLFCEFACISLRRLIRNLLFKKGHNKENSWRLNKHAESYKKRVGTYTTEPNTHKELPESYNKGSYENRKEIAVRYENCITRIKNFHKTSVHQLIVQYCTMIPKITNFLIGAIGTTCRQQDISFITCATATIRHTL